MLLEYYNLNCWLFGILGTSLFLTLTPLHVKFGQGSWTADRFGLGHDWLAKIGMDLIPDHSPVLWVHAVCLCLVMCVTTSLMRSYQTRFVAYRFEWLHSMPPPQSTTLLVDNIP